MKELKMEKTKIKNYSNLGRNYLKSVQVLNWIAKKEGGIADKLKAIKIYWLADRLHLRKYGSTLTNDKYFAMELGPVGSLAKDITGLTNRLAEEQIEYKKIYLSILNKNKYQSIEEVDYGKFSETNLEVLDEVYKLSKDILNFDLVDLTHLYPEWKKHESEIKKNPKSSIVIDLNDFFKNPSIDPLEIFSTQSEDEINKSKAYFQEFNN